MAKLSLNLINEFKKLVIISLVSDDELMEKLVLKGGNAIELGYSISSRASYDLDFSMEEDFEDVPIIMSKIETNLKRVFSEKGYHVFDFDYQIKPKALRDEVKDFWGGYNILFKVIKSDALKSNGTLEYIRRNAIPLSPNLSPKFSIDISKHEYIGKREEREVESYTFYIYGLEMIVLEKVRAICQQLPQYQTIIGTSESTIRGRSRDFYDIYIILHGFKVPLDSEDTKNMLRSTFAAKKVPTGFLKNIRHNKEIHKEDFDNQLKATLSVKTDVLDFDTYFNFVVDTFENILD
jgi:hypothetical protein